MIRKMLLVGISGLLFWIGMAVAGSGTAAAQSCGTNLVTLTNGTTADATQVMANFSNLINCLNSLQGYIGGLTLSNDGSSPQTVIDTAGGIAESDDVTTLMKLGALTKNANAAWVVGSGNGCLDSGSSLAASQWYALFVIERTDTFVVDEVCTKETAGIAPSPTMPSGYTKKRYIGSFKTNSSSQILAFSQNGDEFLWVTDAQDVNTSGLSSASRTLFTLSTPPGVKTNALIRPIISNSSIASGVIFTSPDESDQSGTSGGTYDMNVIVTGSFPGGRLNVRTNTASQIGVRATSGGTSLFINTYGWIDTRGRFQ